MLSAYESGNHYHLSPKEMIVPEIKSQDITSTLTKHEDGQTSAEVRVSRVITIPKGYGTEEEVKDMLAFFTTKYAKHRFWEGFMLLAMLLGFFVFHVFDMLYLHYDWDMESKMIVAMPLGVGMFLLVSWLGRRAYPERYLGRRAAWFGGAAAWWLFVWHPFLTQIAPHWLEDNTGIPFFWWLMIGFAILVSIPMYYMVTDNVEKKGYRLDSEDEDSHDEEDEPNDKPTPDEGVSETK